MCFVGKSMLEAPLAFNYELLKSPAGKNMQGWCQLTLNYELFMCYARGKYAGMVPTYLTILI